MRIEKKQTNEILEKVETYKESKKVKEELELDNKITIEMPVLNALALDSMKKRKEHNDELLEPKQKEVDDLVKETEEQKKESEKKSQSFTESYLNENFKDKWLKENNSYVVSCKGRKELRQLIEHCKTNNIKYKFEKLVEGEYKYSVKCTPRQQEKLVESQMQEINALVGGLKRIYGDDIVNYMDEFANLPDNKKEVWKYGYNILSDDELKNYETPEQAYQRQIVDAGYDIPFDKANISLKRNDDKAYAYKTPTIDYSDILFTEKGWNAFAKWVKDNKGVDYDAIKKEYDKQFSFDESLKEGYGDSISALDLRNKLFGLVDKLNNIDDDVAIPSTSGTYGHSGEFVYLDNVGFVYFDEIDKLLNSNFNEYYLYVNDVKGNMNFYDAYKNFDDAYKESQDYEYVQIFKAIVAENGEELDSDLVYKRNSNSTEQFYDDELQAAYNESLDTTQKLIDDAKKFAKDNNKDVKVKGVVSSNECSIDTYPEDFNEMVKLFSSKFDVYDEDEELERFKIKEKSVSESLKEELQVVGDLKDFAPNDKALPLWNEIVKNNLLDDFDLVLSDLYPDGVTIEQLNKLLSFDQDFVKSMIGLDSEPEIDLRAEADKEFEDSLEDTIERDLEDNDEDDNVEDIESVLNDTEEEEQDKEVNVQKNPYINTSTGYGEDDLPDDDETYLD